MREKAIASLIEVSLWLPGGYHRLQDLHSNRRALKSQTVLAKCSYMAGPRPETQHSPNQNAVSGIKARCRRFDEMQEVETLG